MAAFLTGPFDLGEVQVSDLVVYRCRLRCMSLLRPWVVLEGVEIEGFGFWVANSE